jgi:hypothetical protein
MPRRYEVSFLSAVGTVPDLLAHAVTGTRGQFSKMDTDNSPMAQFYRAYGAKTPSGKEAQLMAHKDLVYRIQKSPAKYNEYLKYFVDRGNVTVKLGLTGREYTVNVKETHN